jgi:hypothetical protein
MGDLLAESLKAYPEENLNEFDATSLKKIISLALGYFGPAPREEGLNLLERYIAWAKKQPADSFEDVGVDPYAAINKLEEDVKYMRKYNPDYENKDQLFSKFNEFKNSLQK